MKNAFIDKLKESLTAVLPIAAIILVLAVALGERFRTAVRQ